MENKEYAEQYMKFIELISFVFLVPNVSVTFPVLLMSK